MKKRQFKFRAWDKVEKKFIEGVPPREYMLDEDADWDRRDCETEDPRFYPKTILSHDLDGRIIYTQYTEINDKNKKDIYEGDILKLVNGCTGWVSYENGGYLFNGHLELEPEDGDLVTASLSYVRPTESEVIGNIFENEELK